MISAVLHDGVDAGDLLEQLQTAANDQSSPETGTHYDLVSPPPWSPGGLMLTDSLDHVPGPGLEALVPLHSLLDLPDLGLGVVAPGSDLLEDLRRLLVPVLAHQPPGGLGHEDES